MAKKIIPIKYTSRDFEKIKNDLIEHAKRYYPNTYKDFNEGGFGSLMLDTVAYVGDILSFYLDYQANESFLETASEFSNILKIAKQMGFKYNNGYTSSGIASFYITVPAVSVGLGPDLNYAPILKKGTILGTSDRTRFILNEDVRFDDVRNEKRAIKDDGNGSTTYYGIKAYGRVVSGDIKTERITIGEYQKFLKIELSDPNIVEILTVTDSEGNDYYEVDYLSQNVIFKSVTNKDTETSKTAKEILKPYLVPRRFTSETLLGKTYLQFGASAEVEIENNNFFADPSKAILQLHGKDYISSDSFDPSRLLNNDKLGIAPSNTILTIVYRKNDSTKSVNFGTDALNTVLYYDFSFKDEQNLNKDMVEVVKKSVEVTNESPILGDVSDFNTEELKIRIKNSFSMQNRAVTESDYKALSYAMPAKFGSIKRVSVIKDENSLKRNLNLYVLSEDSDGLLTSSNQIVKNNLKHWIEKSKMLNDTIDILDGKIINYGIEFIAIGSPDKSKYDTLSDALEQLRKDFSILPEFGEPFMVNNILLALKKVPSILDVVSVRITSKNGGNYSLSNFNIEENLTADKRYVKVPLNAVMELKFPVSDIKGTIL